MSSSTVNYLTVPWYVVRWMKETIDQGLINRVHVEINQLSVIFFLILKKHSLLSDGLNGRVCELVMWVMMISS